MYFKYLHMEFKTKYKNCTVPFTGHGAWYTVWNVPMYLINDAMHAWECLPHPKCAMADSKKRQWQRYIDESLLKTNQVTNAAIYGLDGTQWATSKDFDVRKLSNLHVVYVLL